MFIKYKITGKTYDEERALYNTKFTEITDCRFEGPADGESVLKESSQIKVDKCRFSLRYPLWHVSEFSVNDTTMDEKTRAAIWYSENGVITNSRLTGIKAVRECRNIHISDCFIESEEFGWKSSDISLSNLWIESEYLFFDSRKVDLQNVRMMGKYSFQYMEDLTITSSVLDTKDAFWHSKNVTVKDSVIKGEYLAWFSENLTLENCKIIGTQPFCYCKNLKLINCIMEETDLAFEYSEVDAIIEGNILSVKNPEKGTIVCDSVGEVIMENSARPCSGKVIVRQG